MSHDDDSSTGSAVPPDAESILQEEMLKLSLEDRNKFQEEIHGVKCIAKEESPEFLREALRQLDLELKSDNLPFDQRKAYLMSQELSIRRNKPTYVNSDEFRLRFLRIALFDIQNAASEMTRYLNAVSRLFGEYALQRPIRINDFSKEELREFRKGRYQFLPYRDRAGVHGRRIMACFPDDEWGKLTYDLRAKIWLYLASAAAEDVDVQKNGIVIIAWFDESWESISRSPFADFHTNRFSRSEGPVGIRISSFHMCTPDTLKSRFRRSMMMLRIGKYVSKVKIHVGNSVENMYTLQGFGIPVDYIPISFTGKVKEKYIKEWMRLRQLIEDERMTQRWTVGNNNSMIESPYLDDIIFRNGTSLLSHPGNIGLRSAIVEKCMLKEDKQKNTKDLVSEIISEIKRGNGRFLVWNEKGWWKKVETQDEPKELFSKISRIVRDTRKLIKERQEARSTSGFSSSDSETQEPDRLSRKSYMFTQSDGTTSHKRQKLSQCFFSAP